MKEITTVTKVYKFAELSEEAKKHALEKLYDVNTDYDWHEFSFETFETILNMIGIDSTVKNISYSGFSSQGDGLSFVGRYSYKKGALKAIKKEFPTMAEVHSIVQNIQDIQKKCFYGIIGEIKRNSYHYCHENTVSFSVDDYSSRKAESLEDEIEMEFRSLMQEFYSMLEKEHEYLTSEKAIIETIEANDYDFTENGRLF
jgi:hypothetical protein